MAKSIRIGVDLDRGRQPLMLDPDFLRTHMHLVGATGAGKTTAIHALLRPIMKDHRRKCSLFVIDPMGSLSADLLQWIASRKCPEHVRERLVYIEPAREESVVPINPLTFVSEAHRYYQVARAVDLILRAWAAQDLGQQPRLMQWSYRAMCSMAAMGYPISMSRYLLHPGSQEHTAILHKLPGELQHHWQEILKAKGGEAVRILESVRNRFDPFYEAPQARRMFGTFESRFDTERFIRERRIVIVNVAKLGRIPERLGNTLGSMILNEVFETAFNMATLHGRQAVEPTYVLMDEFQRFVGPDIEEALPTVRQMGLRLILAHQSFSQLEQGDIDLSHMIWQARNRLMFANSAKDAEIIANELAILTFDPMKIKQQLMTRRQLIAGYRTEWLSSKTTTDTHADSRIDQHSVGFNRSDGKSRPSGQGLPTQNEGSGTSHGHTTGGTVADSHGVSNGQSESLVPIHEEFNEISSINYVPFDEHFLEWQRIIRQLRTGVAFGQFVNDPKLHHLKIDFDPVVESPRAQAAFEELLARNFEQDIFISKEEADRLAEQERLRLLTEPPISLTGAVLDLPPRLTTDPAPLESPLEQPEQLQTQPPGSTASTTPPEASDKEASDDTPEPDEDTPFRRPPRT